MRTTALVSLAVFAAGCVGPYYRMADVEVDPDRYEVIGPVEAAASGGLISSVIPIGYADTVERAVERALDGVNGDEMIDIEIQQRWYWAYVWIGSGVRVRGVALRDLAKPAESGANIE